MKAKLLLIAMLLTNLAYAETTVFVNVNVIPMTTESVLQGQSVVIRDGQIQAIGSSTSVPLPAGAKIVDGSGQFLIPGLAEMHAHITNNSDFERLATLFVANGVTTIRGMLGRSSHLQLRDQLNARERFGPRLVTSGPSFNNRTVSGSADAESRAREQHAAGYDFLKIHPGLTLGEFTATAMTANDLDMPVAGHVPADVGLAAALQLKIATIDHLDGYFAALTADQSVEGGGYFNSTLAAYIESEDIAALADATAMAGVWNVPTQVLVEQVVNAMPPQQFAARPEMKYVSAATVRGWVYAKQQQLDDESYDAVVAKRAIELRRQLILALHDAGAGLLLGSDAPQIFNVPGFSLHRELDVLVAAGLTPYEALQTGTTAVAKFLRSNAGEIVVGRDADLILLRSNPLQEINNIRSINGVMVRGQWYSRDELDRRLALYVKQK